MFAQEKKYQSLLWEVSGNGLAKKSYLYGSMHVSDKVSFNLSDAFFTHLLNADIVANESDPATWPELTNLLYNERQNFSAGFYSSFYVNPMQKEQLLPLFASNSYTLNRMLSRTNEMRVEDQEETYLDMFIYRTGKKYNKTTVGLEDTKKSIISMMNVDNGTMNPTEIDRAALQKLLKNVPYQEAMSNFYREKDLDMMDSLSVLVSPQPYLKVLLYDRNIIMANAIDSLAKKGSLFAAIGALHLPGKKGVIETLRKMGYTVTPVHSTFTQKGITQKQQIESYFVKPVFKQYTTPDGMISLPLFAQVMENREGVESPDITNGGYLTVKRLLLADFLKKDNKPFDHRSLDSLVYENTKGRILDKKVSTANGYTIYDIKSTTKTGNAQRYKYFITPLEIIAVNMSGDGNYVRRFEDDVYNNIIIKPQANTWVKATPKKGGFTAELPSYYISYGDLNKEAPENIDMYANSGDAKYFLLERTLQLNDHLEDTRFELERMHYEFYANLKTDSIKTQYTQNPPSFTSAAAIGSKTIKLKSVVQGPKYYILGTVGAADGDTKRFFNSFSTTSLAASEDFYSYTDSVAGFTVMLPKKQNEKLSLSNRKPKAEKDEKANLFYSGYVSRNFIMPSGQVINYRNFGTNRYNTERSIDSVWASLKKVDTQAYEYDEDDDDAVYEEESGYTTLMAGKKGINPSQWNKILYKKSGKDNKLSITGEKQYHDPEKNIYQLDYMVTAEKSEQAIKTRYYYRDGKTYKLVTTVPKGYAQNDPYIEKVFNSFTLPAATENRSGQQDKFKLFMEDAASENDTIRYSAFESANNLELTEKDVPDAINFLKSFDFSAEELQVRSTLYRSLGDIKHPLVIPFLEAEYKKEDISASQQFTLLNALAAQDTKEAFKKILELMEYDLPLSGDEYSVQGLFETFGYYPDNSPALFPDILQFYSIKEYHGPIVELSAKLLDEKAIKANKIKSYKKMILTSAKLELKRAKSRKDDESEDMEAVTTYMDDGYYSAEENDDLNNFIGLLYPFRKEKGISTFFSDVKKLNSKKQNLELARLNAINKQDMETLEPLLDKPATLFTVYNMENVKSDLSAAKKITDDQLALSAIYVRNNLKEKDSVTFADKKIAVIKGQKASFYFYSIEAAKGEDSFYKPTKQLAGVAFLNNEDGSINSLAYKFIEADEIIDEDKIQKSILAEIDRAVNEDKPRTNSDFSDYNRRMNPYDIYD